MIFKGILLLVFFIGALMGQDLIPQKARKKNFLSPPPQIKYFTLGYNDMISGMLWIRLLQDIDFCEGGRVQEGDFVLPSKNELDKTKGVLERPIKPSRCHKGWAYQMLNTISEVHPTFKLAYDPGATYLSVIVDDREGARLMFEKGLQKYPEDWMINFKAGYHYLWEIQDARRSAVLLDKAGKTGAPPIVVALAAALYNRTGQAQLAKVILEDALAKNPTGIAADRIKIRLEEVHKILAEKPAQESPQKAENP